MHKILNAIIEINDTLKDMAHINKFSKTWMLDWQICYSCFSWSSGTH